MEGRQPLAASTPTRTDQSLAPQGLRSPALDYAILDSDDDDMEEVKDSSKESNPQADHENQDAMETEATPQQNLDTTAALNEFKNKTKMASPLKSESNSKLLESSPGSSFDSNMD